MRKRLSRRIESSAGERKMLQNFTKVKQKNESKSEVLFENKKKQNVKHYYIKRKKRNERVRAHTTSRRKTLLSRRKSFFPSSVIWFHFHAEWARPMMQKLSRRHPHTKKVVNFTFAFDFSHFHMTKWKNRARVHVAKKKRSRLETINLISLLSTSFFLFAVQLKLCKHKARGEREENWMEKSSDGIGK